MLSVTSQISARRHHSHEREPPSITERTGQATSRLGDTVPIISVRETDTLVRVRQGETVVIAGLMQETRNSHRPVEGAAARRCPRDGGQPVSCVATERRRTKTDLIILLTPTGLMRGPNEVGRDERSARG